jgi:sulfate permease, SulP family
MKPTAILSWIKNQFNILNWLPDYTKEEFSADLKSGVTVGVIEIPQVMAYAVIAGLSPIYGLYGSLIPLLIYPLFGTSRHLALGTVATDMIIIATGASMIADPGTDQYVSVVLLLTLFVGVVHISLSLMRMGWLVNLLSKPVIYGFMIAAPLIIGASQLGNFFGVETERSQYVGNLIMQIIQQFDQINNMSVLIGVIGIGFLFIMRKLFPIFPRAFVLIAGGGVAVWALNFQQLGVDVIGVVPSGLPSFQLHEFTLEDIRQLIPTAATLVLVQLMSVMSIGKTFASKYKYPLNANREFFAVGMSNLVGSFFQSPPISGSFSRTAVSEQAGRKTALSNVFVAIVIGLTLLFLTPLFYYIPIPALAAIIIAATISMIDLKEIRYFFRTKPEDAYIAIFTAFSVLVIGIQEGILLGISASLIAVLYHSSRPNMSVLGHVHGSREFRDVDRNPKAIPIEEILILRFDTSIAFNNAEIIKDFIIQKSEESNKKIRAIIVDAKSINDLDTTAIEVFQSVVETLEKWDIELHFAGLKKPVLDLLLKSGLAREMGGAHFHNTTHKAVKFLLNKWDAKEKSDSDREEYQSVLDKENGEGKDESEEKKDKEHPEHQEEKKPPHRLSDYLKNID